MADLDSSKVYGNLNVTNELNVINTITSNEEISTQHGLYSAYFSVDWAGTGDATFASYPGKLMLSSNANVGLTVDTTGTVNINGTGGVAPFTVHAFDAANIRNGMDLVSNYYNYTWSFWIDASNNLMFQNVDTSGGGYISSTAGPGQMNFTGQHRVVPTNVSGFTNIQNFVGMIVVSDGTYYNINWGTDPTINESLPNISLSNKSYDKRVFGVISDREDITDGQTTYGYGAFLTIFQTYENIGRIIINSLGEGGILVTNYNGNLENGDYITSSDITGYGMKQSDDLLHNYTVAKITQNCDFSDPTKYTEIIYNNITYKKQFVGCTYHCG